jgi:hypothetical protein
VASWDGWGASIAWGFGDHVGRKQFRIDANVPRNEQLAGPLASNMVAGANSMQSWFRLITLMAEASQVVEIRLRMMVLGLSTSDELS